MVKETRVELPTYPDGAMIIVFSAALFVIATLYASVGQAGATGYIALMGVSGFGPEVIKPTALALNIAVAAIGTARFAHAGLLRREQCVPFIFLGAPFSILGGALHLPAHLYGPIVGALLVGAAIQLVLGKPKERPAWHAPPFIPALIVGGIIGFVAGVTGAGGGIFLAPLLIVLAWSPTIPESAAVAALFNLLNSLAALIGAWRLLPNLPAALPWWLAIVFAGGLLGTSLSLSGMPTAASRYLLAVILLASSVRLFWG